MRDDLRGALSRLHGDALYALYSGPPDGTFDLENVLFYNVGCSVFRPVATRCIRFERSHSSPPAPTGRTLRWHHLYTTDRPSPRWSASRDGVELRLQGAGRLPATAAAWWAAAHSAHADAHANLDVAPLALDLHLTSMQPVNLTERVKKLTDGLLCALHSASAPPSEQLVLRIASVTGLPPTHVFRNLSRSGPMGPAKFVWPYRQGLQWSPADDRLVSVNMTWSQSTGNEWSLVARMSAAVSAG